MAYRSIEDALALGTGVERTFLCHVHDDHNASASINSITGLWICYSCGARGKVDVSEVEVPTATVDRLLRQTYEAVVEPRGPLDESYLDLYDAAGPGEYWLSRFSPETCRRFRLGFDYEANAATYPLRAPNGDLLGIVDRPMGLTEGPKYRYPYGIKINELLFGYHLANAPGLVLTEGAADAIACYEVGVDAVASYGSNLSRQQVTLLHRYAPQVILLGHDQDQAGDKAAALVQRYFPHSVRMRWEGYKDLAEMPVSVRSEILQEYVQKYI